MKNGFRRYVAIRENALGRLRGDDELVGGIYEKLSQIKELEKDLSLLLNRVTTGHDPLQHATQHFMNALDSLKKTIDTSFRKNANNPDNGDHPPISTDDPS